MFGQEADLGLFEQSDPARASFGEYAPFFDSYGWAGRSSVFGGSQSTVGEQISLINAADGHFVGIGQAHYASDGFRVSTDVTHTLASVEGRIEIAPRLSLLANTGWRRTEAEDRSLSFDFANDNPTTDTQRLGGYVYARFRRPVGGVL